MLKKYIDKIILIPDSLKPDKHLLWKFDFYCVIKSNKYSFGIQNIIKM